MADVTIVGAGLAGLACARRLAQCGISCEILEASDGVGGRVRTDIVDGFRLDRGFQIYLTAYPEGHRVLDLDELRLKPFTRGALVHFKDKLYPLIDPRSSPRRVLGSMNNPIGSLRDKLRLLSFASKIDAGPGEGDFDKDNRLTLDLLRVQGHFSEAMIERFFKPFFGGVFLERKLTTSSRFFRFVFRCFASGEGAVPEFGMGEIPKQLADRLPPQTIRLNSPVESIESLKSSRAVVVATDGRSASKLFGASAVPVPKFHGGVTLWYDSPTPLTGEPILVLDGEGKGVVNNVVEMSAASPSYAPPGRHLIAASTIGMTGDAVDKLDSRVRAQMAKWFPGRTEGWRLLRADRIADALPDMSAATFEPPQRPVRLRPGLYVCGDHRDNSSIDGALSSGFRTAQAVMEDLHAGRC